MSLEEQISSIGKQLARVAARVDHLEGRNAQLEAQLESRTKLLKGLLEQAVSALEPTMASTKDHPRESGSSFDRYDAIGGGRSGRSGRAASPEFGGRHHGGGWGAEESGAGSHSRPANGFSSLDKPLHSPFNNGRRSRAYSPSANDFHSGSTRRHDPHNSERPRYARGKERFSQRSRSRSRSRSRDMEARHASIWRSGGSKSRGRDRDRSKSRSRSPAHGWGGAQKGHRDSDSPSWKRQRSFAEDPGNDKGASGGWGSRKASSGNFNDNAPGFGRDRPTHKHSDRKPKQTGGWPELDANNNIDSTGWEVVAFSDHSEDPVMPTSVNRFTSSSKGSPNALDKVLQWQHDSNLSDGEKEVEDVPFAAAAAAAKADPGGDSVGDNAGVSSSSDEDDDDDDDPMMMLRSKAYRSERAFVGLVDAKDNELSLDRVASAWGPCAWVPLEGLSEHYKLQHQCDLWTADTKKSIKKAMKNLSEISERNVLNEESVKCTLLLKANSHLKKPLEYQRVFVKSPVPEPVLFFFLVSTVLRPLDGKQGELVVRLWTDEFKKGPVGLTTVKRSDGYGQNKWLSSEALWNAALKWLRELGTVTGKLGRSYMLNKISGWDQDPEKAVKSTENDPDADLVGVRRRRRARKPRIGSLGLGSATSTKGRRCYSSSAVLFSESTPLLMEHGQEFFATPKPYCGSGYKKGADASKKASKSSKSRRTFTEPSFSILEALPELDSEVECYDDPALRSATSRKAKNKAPVYFDNAKTPRVSVASTACGEVLQSPTNGPTKGSEQGAVPSIWPDTDTWTICEASLH
ncbi:hypothetical protein GGI12_004190 [Dipsacomyces acuminosporus]|nr:hypothetical protein GGI12_004190 [Dipsacomyces acuminosporus]